MKKIFEDNLISGICYTVNSILDDDIDDVIVKVFNENVFIGYKVACEHEDHREVAFNVYEKETGERFGK